MSVITEHIQPILDGTISAALLAMLLMANAAAAQEHLVPAEPDDSFISADYETLIATVLKEAFAPDVAIRVIIRNPLTSERAIGIRPEGGTARIFGLASEERLFSYAEIDAAKHEGESEKEIESWIEFLGPLPANPADVKVDRCEFTIPPALDQRIEAIWNVMLAGTHRDPPPKPVPGPLYTTTTTVDGTIFEFANRDGKQGTIYAPSAAGEAAEFIGIVDVMKDLCTTGNTNLTAKLSDKVARLDRHLESEQRK